MKQVFFITALLLQLLQSLTVSSQAFNLDSFFSEYNAITFYSNDSDNFIYPEVQTFDDLKNLIEKDCPFSIAQAEHPEYIIPVDTLIPLLGLHNQLPDYDTVLQEVKGQFYYDTILQNWYAYLNKSKIDSTTAFLIIPGTGIHGGFHIAEGNPTDYQNMPVPIKDVCLPYGDVYTYVKPNEDYRNIWKNSGSPYYKKLDYNYYTPYTDLHGNHWAANMTIESIAIVRYLKMKYDKVIVLGLSNGGIAALIAAVEGWADGVNCASGLSVTDYDGFPLTNFENPYYANQFHKYSLDSLKTHMPNSYTYYLFSYGSGDGSTVGYEYDTHSLQDSLSTVISDCHLDFNYNFSGHHYPVAYLDTFFTRVKNDSCKVVFPSILTPQTMETISFYPNPVHDQLIIQAGQESILSLRITDMKGRICYMARNLNPFHTEISLVGLPSGHYIIQLMTDKTSYIKLLAKE